MTGFVPLQCWDVIEMVDNGLSLEETLNGQGMDLINEVAAESKRFYDTLPTESEQKIWISFIKDAYKSCLGETISSSSIGRNDWHCWDLRYISCGLEELKKKLCFYGPRALSKSIALGMMEVILFYFIFINYISSCDYFY